MTSDTSVPTGDPVTEPDDAIDPIDPITTNTFVGTASGSDDPPAPLKGLRRLMGWIIPANIGIYLIWGAVPGILLPQQITLLFGQRDHVVNLTIVATIGAFSRSPASSRTGRAHGSDAGLPGSSSARWSAVCRSSDSRSRTPWSG